MGVSRVNAEEVEAELADLQWQCRLLHAQLAVLTGWSVSREPNHKMRRLMLAMCSEEILTQLIEAQDDEC
jgi:outer membrane protein TolC